MHRIFPQFVSGLSALGLLVLRVVTGLAFSFHGWGKIQHPFTWMDVMGDEAAPGIFQALAAVAEFGGGIALILGLLTPLAALGIAGTMVVALAKVHLPHGDPFVNPQGGASYEPAAGYLAQMILFLVVGPGKISADFFLFGKKKT